MAATLLLSRRAFIGAGLAGLVGDCAAHGGPSPFSIGSSAPRLAVPPLACDCHIHILDPRYPATPGWKGERVNEATVAAYRRFQARIGTERVVVVTPSTYGIDNSATLDALDQLGQSARGIAVIDCDTPPPDLRALTARGVRGVRMNFVSPQPWGRSDERRLAATARIAADQGWHVQIYAKADQIAAMASAIAALPTDIVIDHLGSVDPSTGPSDDGHRAILRLLAGGRTWLKLSGAYISSKTGAPGYADLMPIARSYVSEAPERLLWGSDWPHRGQTARLPDDAALLDLLLDWAPGARLQQQVLVENPASLYGFG